MQKYITKNMLADFVEQMWDAGIKCDIKPDRHEIVLWSNDLDKMERIDVIDETAYDSLVEEMKSSLGEKLDPSSHTTNVQSNN